MLIINRPLLNDMKMADMYIQQLYKKWPYYKALQGERSRLQGNLLMVAIVWIFIWSWIFLFSLGAKDMFEAVFPISITFLASILFGFTSIILGPIAYLILSKQEKIAMEERAARCKRAQMEINQLCLEGKPYILAIPEIYRYPLATSYLCQIIETGRAETMKEALNLLEEQLHRWRMEQQMNKMLQNQQTINRNINALWIATILLK